VTVAGLRKIPISNFNRRQQLSLTGDVPEYSITVTKDSDAA
jgi:hypothetical protein